MVIELFDNYALVDKIIYMTKVTQEITSQKLFQKILEELRLLREEVKLLLPQEDLESYANPQRIKNSYKKALKKYPPNY